MIGIIGAMDVEVKTLCEKMENEKSEIISGMTFYVGTLCGVDCVVVKCGIGKVAAGVMTEAMILRFAPEIIINTGVGGALAPDLRIGDIVISDRAFQHDMDTSPIGDPVGMISGINKIYFDADEKTAERLVQTGRKLGYSVKRGTVATGDRFISGGTEKSAIVDRFPSAAVCEMEGGAIAHTAYLNNTPFVILRAVSDVVDESSQQMDYSVFAGMAAERGANLLLTYLSDLHKERA